MQTQDNLYGSDLLVIGDNIVSDTDFNLTNMSAQIRQGQSQSNIRNTTLVVQNPFFTLYSTENPNTIDFVFSTVVLADNNVWAGFAFSKDNQMVNQFLAIKLYSFTNFHNYSYRVMIMFAYVNIQIMFKQLNIITQAVKLHLLF
jgi:hypothetical protein